MHANPLTLSGTYQIPGNPETDVYLLPVSGGADSTALAILLHEIAPEIDFRMVFTDTGAEEKETIESLDRLEIWLGKKIERIGEKSLFSLIEEFNGFLPSPRDRVVHEKTQARALSSMDQAVRRAPEVDVRWRASR